MKKRSVIFARDRVSSFEGVIKHGKEIPGVGRYDTYNYDEKIVKPPRANTKLSEDKYNFLDEAKFISSQSPKIYDSVNCDKYKRKSKAFHIRAESEIEKKQLERKWEKTNCPSPATYKTTGCHDHTSKYASSTFYKVNKSPKTSFIDAHVNVKKNYPGVGKYQAEKGLDYVFRPMKKKGY